MSGRLFTPCTRLALMLACTTCIATMQGCGTPQPLLDQANHGAALSISLQTEMANFRATQAAIAQQRLNSVRRQLASMSTYQSESDFDERVKKAASTATTQLYTELRTLADSRIEDEKVMTEQSQQVDADLAKLLSPLPDTTQALGNTQKALAVIGEELSARDRMDSAADFAKQIKAGIEDNKAKIEAAKAATTTAPVQSAADH